MEELVSYAFTLIMVVGFGQLFFFHILLISYNFWARAAARKPEVRLETPVTPWDYDSWNLPQSPWARVQASFRIVEEINNFVVARDDLYSRSFQQQFEWIHRRWKASVKIYLITLVVLPVLGFSWAIYDSWDAPFRDDGPEIYGAGAPGSKD